MPSAEARFTSDDKKPGMFFLDSGAHSLYNEKVKGQSRRTRHDWFGTETHLSPEFKEYVDGYAEFVKQHKTGIDYYVNVDVIYDPARSWLVLQYLENEHGLSPVPVIHHGTPDVWIEKHLEKGYTLIGVGGVGQETPAAVYTDWADRLYRRLGRGNGGKPCARTHGFAMTSFRLMVRYPWWSVDSSSWAKSAAYGSIYIPRQVNGKFCFWRDTSSGREPVRPYIVETSTTSAAPRSGRYGEQGPKKTLNLSGGRGPLDYGDRHISALAPATREALNCWLSKIEIPLGKVGAAGEIEEEGVVSHYGCRAVANLRFFEAMVASLPAWPWAFHSKGRERLFD